MEGALTNGMGMKDYVCLTKSAS